MSPNALAYFILWRVWIRLFTHPDWTSRAESLELVSKLRGEIALQIPQQERDEVYAEVDRLRKMEVI